MVVLLVMALAVLSADVFLLSQRNVTTIVDFNDALAGFRAAPALAAPIDDTTTSTATPSTSTTSTSTPSSAPPTSPGTMPPGSAPPAAPITTAAPTGPAAYTVPAPGVYTYRTTGSERISLASAQHKYPERTYATVRHGSGCEWQYRNEVVKEHVDMLQICSQPGRLTQVEQRRDVSFFGQTEGGSARCDPALVLHGADLAPGHRIETTCASSDGSSFVLTRTFRGHDQRRIGDRTIDVVVVDLQSAMTGKKRGRSADTLWFAADTGLLVRWERMVDTVADTAYGASVHYTEEASFELESLTPSQ
jgi:hypothetical protein